jgi:hypothetical protein
VISPPESSRSWWCCRSCLLLAAVRGAQPRGGWRPFAIARLQGFSSCSPAATFNQWSSTRMTTSLVVREASWAAASPCPQLQGCSSSALGRRASRVGVPPSAWAGSPLLPPAFGGEGRSPALRRRRTSGTRGRPTTGAVGCRMTGSRLGWPRRRLRRCLLPFGWGVAARPPYGRRSRHAQVHHIHGFSRAGARIGGRYKTSYATGAASAFLDGLVLTPAVRTGARTSSRTLGRPPFAGTTLVRRWPLSSVLRWSPPLVRFPTAEVVASAGGTVSATCRRAFDSLALMASLSPPVGRRGREPFRSGVHAEVVATTGGRPPFAGTALVRRWPLSLVQRWPPPLVLRWSPPLVSRSELAIPRPYWCGGSSFLQSRDGTRAPLENRCNTFAFCKVLKSTI